MDAGTPYTPTPTTGAQFGKYRIVRKLGEGAFGSVFEALLPGPMGFTKKVAIKKLRSKLVEEDPRFVQSMINEARIGGLLHHANIVDIIEFGQVGKHYYLAMEYVDGATLEDVVHICRRRQVLLPRFAIVDLALQACRGLHYAHQLKDHGGQPLDLIHRDLKPSNIIVDREGTAKILDFGIAKAASNLYKTTTTGVVKGTPRYMAPEQITGENELSCRADIFSLGAVLYEVITGRVLFHADSLPSLMHKIVASDVSREMEQAEAAFPGCADLLGRALARDPEERFPDARALGDALRELGRAYPAEADMAEVIGRLLPQVDRTDVREIEDSQDLNLDASNLDAEPISTQISDSSRIPIPPPDPASAGWQRFSSVFDVPDGAGAVDSGAATKALAPTPERLSSPPPESSEGSPGDETLALLATTRRGVPPWKIGLAVAVVLGIAGVLLAGYGPWRVTGTEELAELSVLSESTDAPAGVEQIEEDTPTEPLEADLDGVADEVAPTELVELQTEPTATEEPTPEPITPAPEPITATTAPAEVEPPDVEPSTDEAVKEPTEPEPEPPPPLRPGSVSLYTKPWANIHVDGTHVAAHNTLRDHPLEGGTHEIRLVCPQIEDRVKTFTIEVDGGSINLGCWDFTTMAPCGQ